MITYIIPLLGSMSLMWSYVLFLIVALAFVATIPVIFRDFFGR